MIKKLLGKIESAEFGTIKDYPFLIGLQLWFSMNGCGVGDGGRYTVNISKQCKWDSEQKRLSSITTIIEEINNILEQAKVNYVSELKGIPVEVTIKNSTFESFRVLTEVL